MPLDTNEAKCVEFYRGPRSRRLALGMDSTLPGSKAP